MIAYASRTGTKRNLRALRAAGWRLMVSAAGVLRTEGFPYALDNGAWSAHTQGRPFDVAAFERAVDLLGFGADWIVVPDVVGDAPSTLRMAEEWLPRLARFPVLLAVQDGMTAADVGPWLSPRTGIFVGGSTDWKLGTMRAWAQLARARGALIHVGRVNTARRIERCAEAGVDSFDGSSVSRFADNLPRLDRATRRLSLAEVLRTPRVPSSAWERRALAIVGAIGAAALEHGLEDELFRRMECESMSTAKN